MNGLEVCLLGMKWCNNRLAFEQRSVMLVFPEIPKGNSMVLCVKITNPKWATGIRGACSYSFCLKKKWGECSRRCLLLEAKANGSGVL